MQFPGRKDTGGSTEQHNMHKSSKHFVNIVNKTLQGWRRISGAASCDGDMYSRYE